MFALVYADPIRPIEIDVVLGDGFLMTAHGPDWDPRATHHLRGDGLAGVLARGPDHLLWAICDDLVDGYFPLLDRLGDEIDLLQDAVIERAPIVDPGAAVSSSSGTSSRSTGQRPESARSSTSRRTATCPR